MVVAPTVIITDSKAEGPSPIDLPTCQRVAVLKNLPCSPIEPRKMCGGGSSFGIGPAHHPAQLPDAGEQADRQAASTTTLASQSQPAIDVTMEARYRRRAGCSGGGALRVSRRA